MNAIIQQFQTELTPAERHAFEAHAARAGRLPGAHLKSILFADHEPPALPGSETAIALTAKGRRGGGCRAGKRGPGKPNPKARRRSGSASPSTL